MKTSKTPPLLHSYRDLIAELRRLCKEKRTGTVFLASEDGHIVRFVLSKGDIIHLVFDTKHSCYDAIPLIHQIKHGRLQFAEGIVEATQEGTLPNTEELLHTLELFYELDEEEILAQKKEEISAQKKVAKPQVTKTPVVSSSPFTTSRLGEAVPRLKKALAIYLGPFATIVCDDYLKKVGTPKTPEEVLAMIDVVASEIDNPGAEKEFKIKTKEEMFQSGVL